jgi:hypothetical protein
MVLVPLPPPPNALLLLAALPLLVKPNFIRW